MAHDDELELTYGDFSRYPGSPGIGIDLDPPLPAYSEEEDDAVTLAMRPLEEQLAQPGPELAWMRGPVRAAALQAPAVISPPAVALPAPPVARAPSVRPPAAPVAFAPPPQVASPAFVPPQGAQSAFVPPQATPPAFVPPAVASRPPPFAGYDPAPSPPVPAVRSESVPSLPAPVARAVVPASPLPAAVRPPQIAAPQARAFAQTRIVRRKPKGDLLLTAFATAVFALVAMLGTGAVLYRIGVFEPGSVSAAH